MTIELSRPRLRTQIGSFGTPAVSRSAPLRDAKMKRCACDRIEQLRRGAVQNAKSAGLDAGPGSCSTAPLGGLRWKRIIEPAARATVAGGETWPTCGIARHNFSKACPSPELCVRRTGICGFPD